MLLFLKKKKKTNKQQRKKQKQQEQILVTVYMLGFCFCCCCFFLFSGILQHTYLHLVTVIFFILHVDINTEKKTEFLVGKQPPLY